MRKIKDVLVPDIGEFAAVEVIEVLVKSVAAVSVEDQLLRLCGNGEPLMHEYYVGTGGI